MSDPNQKIKDKRVIYSVMTGGVMAIFPLIFSIMPAIGASVVKKAFIKYMNSSPCLCNQKMTKKSLENYRYLNEQEEFKKKLSTMRLALGGPWRFPSLPKVSKVGDTGKKTASDDVRVDTSNTAEGSETEPQKEQQKTGTKRSRETEPQESPVEQNSSKKLKGGETRPKVPRRTRVPVFVGYETDKDDPTKLKEKYDYTDLDYPPGPETFVKGSKFGFLILHALITSFIAFVVFWVISGAILDEQVKLCAGPKCECTKKGKNGKRKKKDSLPNTFIIAVAQLELCFSSTA